MANYYENCTSNSTDQNLAPRRNYSSSSQQSFVSAEFGRLSPALSSAGSSTVKIIDIQKKKSPSRSLKPDVELNEEQHRRGGSGEATGSSSISRNQNQLQPQQQQIDAAPTGGSGVSRWSPQVAQRANSGTQQNQQRQQEQLGELSSFESDYDLLLYLGETETEDIVDTEQSLDYQDQTWRQSICGGASLAPTIDGSFSELLGPSTTPSRNIQDFDLLNTPTPQATSVSPFLDRSYPQRSVREAPVTSEQHEIQAHQYSARQLSRNRRYDKQKPESDDQECDYEVSAAFQADLTPPSRTKRDFLPPSRKRRFPAIESDQLKSATLEDPRRRGQKESMEEDRASTMARFAPMKNSDVDELDRLLAEMSESLDLKALARYDTRPVAATGKASNIVGKQQVNYKDKLQSAAPTKPMQIKASNESILDEYDGASRILEQMIAEQLEGPPSIGSGRSRTNVPVQPVLTSKQPLNQSQDHYSSRSSSTRESPWSVISGVPTTKPPPPPPPPAIRARQSSLSKSVLLNREEEQPPKPPAPDYFTDEEHSKNKNSGIIKLEAANPEVSDAEEPESQINRMKRRTLSSMRSVRHKIGNLINQSSTQNDPQTLNKEDGRSMSLGRNGAEPKTNGTEQERESRSFRRRAMHNHNVNKENNKPTSESFGEQIRRRLSRSKSRVSKWLLRGSRWEKRAQSTPNTKIPQVAATQNEEDEQDNLLFQFQPGDIARNSRLEKSPPTIEGDSFDQSLDRHLARDMAIRKASITESSDFSHLSGLERGPEKKTRPPRLRSRRVAREQRAAEEQKARTESLISLKRLSNSPSPQLPNATGSGTQVVCAKELGGTTRSRGSGKRAKKARNKKRRREQKAGSSSESNGESSSSSGSSKSFSIEQNREYFGQRQSRPKSCDPKSPNRSQSLRSIRSTSNQNHNQLIDDPKIAKSITKHPKSGKRTVSFSNLSTRRSTPTTSTFRPVSAMADKLPAEPTQLDRLDGRAHQLEGGVTPVGLSPASSPAPVRPESAQGSRETARAARIDELPLPRVPVRAKSTALLTDFKNMCTDLLGGHGRATSSSHPPVPPPRRSRAKSAGPKESDESVTTNKNRQTGGRLSSLAAQLKHSAADFFSPNSHVASQRLADNRLEDKHQAPVVVDVKKSKDSNAEEKLFWCEWKPVIEVPTARGSSFSRKFRPHHSSLINRKRASDHQVESRENFNDSSMLPGLQAACVLNEAEQSYARTGVRKQHSLQLDTDSTWESSSCEGNDDRTRTNIQNDQAVRQHNLDRRRGTNESSSMVSFKVNDILVAAATEKQAEDHEQDSSASSNLITQQLKTKRDKKELGDKLLFAREVSNSNELCGEAKGVACVLVESDNNNNNNNTNNTNNANNDERQQVVKKEFGKKYEQLRDSKKKDITLASSGLSYFPIEEGIPLKSAIDNKLGGNKQATRLTAHAAMAVDVERNSMNNKKKKNTKNTLEEDHSHHQPSTKKKQEFHNNNNHNNSDILVVAAAAPDIQQQQQQQQKVVANIHSSHSCEDELADESSKLEFEQPQKVCQRQFTFSSDLPAPKEIHKLHISSDLPALENSVVAGPTSGSPTASTYAERDKKMALSSSRSRVAGEQVKSLMELADGDEESRREEEKEEEDDDDEKQTKSIEKLPSTPVTSDDNDTQEKRLSLYENVKQPQQQTRKLPIWPPPVSEPPIDLLLRSESFNNNKSKQESNTETSVDVDDNSAWSLNDETPAIVNSRREEARAKRAQKNNKLNKKEEADLMSYENNKPLDTGKPERRLPPERKLIHMLSIIQDPNDELMVTKADDPTATTAAAAASSVPSTYKQSTVSLNRQDSSFSLADSNNNNNSDSESSILQQVASNKQRLLARFEPQLQSQMQTVPISQRANIRSGPFAEGRVANAMPSSSSRVKRLAKNFESAAYSSSAHHQQPPVAQQRMLHPQPSEEDPRSEATTSSDWYDTNEQLDEAELAKFLDEFDAGNSVSTGADPFVTVADSTLADDALAVSPSPGGRRKVKLNTTLNGDNDKDDDDDDDEDDTLNDADENDDLLSACDLPDLTNEKTDDVEIDDADVDQHHILTTNEQGKEMNDCDVRAARSTIDSSSSKPVMNMMMELSDGMRDFSTASDATTCVSIPATGERVGGDEQATTTSSDNASSVVAAHKYKPSNNSSSINNNFISNHNNNNNPTDANDNNNIDILKTDKTLTPHEHPHNHHINQQDHQLTPRSCEPKTSEAAAEAAAAVEAAASFRSQVDDSFKDSLNLIIGNQQQMGVPSITNTTTGEQKHKQTETFKSGDSHGARKELKGLTRYYRAILRRRKGRSKSTSKCSKSSKEAVEIRDYIHSSSSSNGESSDSDDSSESFEVSNGRLSNRAKSGKNSRLFEELEKIFARKVEEANDTNSQNRRSTLTDGAYDEDDEYYYEGSINSALNSTGYDQVSLSSSSVSCESIPEIRQRQNLQKLYNIVKEIHSSEAKFVDTLKLLNVELRAHMEPLMSSSNLSHQTESLSLLLRHLPQLQALNESLLEELGQAMNEWPRTRKIAHVLVKIGPFLKHYSTYIRDFDSLQQQLTEAQRKYPQLAERIRQFETRERCQRLTIQHHFLKPIQRIPQYRLLLQQYLHYLKPDDLDYEDTVNALEVVSRVAEHANQAMNEGVNFAKLLALQAKIVGKQRDIVQPGRLFIREGELMKVCRKQVQPRWFVLLNDALLYLTQIQSSDILYLNNELPLDDCQVSTPSEQQANLIGQQFDTEFTVCTRARSFALVAKTREERDQWVASFRQTIDEHQARKRSFSAVRSLSFNNNKDNNNIRRLSNSDSSVSGQLAHSLSSGQLPNEAFNHPKEQLLGLKAPLWTPDSRVSMCQLCTSSFSALFRRHHCRACGKVVCSACSSNRAPLMYLKCRAARTCDLCFNLLRANIHLYYLASNSPERTSQHSEQELKRLDDHFRTLLKSQFVKHAEWRGLAKIARTASSGSSKSAHRYLTTTQQQQPSDNDKQQQQSQKQNPQSTATTEKPPANDSGSLISGYLHRRHAHKAKWKRQWFVITRKEKVLFAYRAIDDVAHVNSLPLLGYQVDQPKEPVDGLESSTLLRLTHLSSYSTKISNKQPKPIIHLFKAESVGAAERWLEALKKSVVLDNDEDDDD